MSAMAKYCFKLLVILKLVLLANFEATANVNSSFAIKTINDIQVLARMVLTRSQFIIDPSQRIEADEAHLDKLQDYLYVSQQRQHSLGGRRVYPATTERNLKCPEMKKASSRTLCSLASSHCLSARNMANLASAPTLHSAIVRLCPLFLLRQTRPMCKPFSPHPSDDDFKTKLQLVEPPIEKVWGFGILFVTLSIVVSMGGLILLPFLHRENRRTILTLFEGLAVGGLVGTSILHLFPQAFDIAGEKLWNYFSKVFLVFTGIYAFYIFEHILKLWTTLCGKGKKKRSSSFREEDITIPTKPHNSLNSLKDSIEMLKDVHINATAMINKSPKDQMRKCLASINSTSTKLLTVPDQAACSKETDKSALAARKQILVPDVAGRRMDHDTGNTMAADSVAWMIVLGDASLNFLDGLSIGAAFDRNILAGISISVAVMLEEVTHRLGTFAVLIRAGMNMKQSFFYILLSAFALYPGLVLGVFLGDAAEDASPYIFALAGGMFLYMALVDMMKEMNRSVENATRKGLKSALHILALQNLGIIIAIIFLSVLALYEEEMNFEMFRIKELAERSMS